VNAYTGEEKLGELLIDIFSAKAVDGSDVKFQDIYIQKFAEKNYNWFDKNRKWLLGNGVTKNCSTRLTVTSQSAVSTEDLAKNKRAVKLIRVTFDGVSSRLLLVDLHLNSNND
jgi:hypothetical protein